jgi:hypothetical protein
VTPIREGETILADYILIRIFLAVLLKDLKLLKGLSHAKEIFIYIT